MALFAPAQDTAAATAERATGHDHGSCCVAHCQMVDLAKPCSVLPPIAPALLPPLFGASGIPFPAFFPPLFAPFAGGAPAFFCPLFAGFEAPYGWWPQLNTIAESPSESSASTGSPAHSARLSPVGKKLNPKQQGPLHRFAPLHHRRVAGSASRTSLESCSGPCPGRSKTPPLARAVSSDDIRSSMRESETHLDFGGPSESLQDGVVLPGIADDGGGGAAPGEVVTAAEPPQASEGTSSRWLTLGQLPGDVAVDALEDSSCVPNCQQDGSEAALRVLPALPLASRTDVSPGGSSLSEGKDAGASGQAASGRVPLLCRSGALMWVDVRRYGAILRRRRQRAERQLQQGALAVAGAAFNRHPLRCVSRRSLTLLCAQAQARARLLQSTGVGTAAAATVAVGGCNAVTEADMDVGAVDGEGAPVHRLCMETLDVLPRPGNQPKSGPGSAAPDGGLAAAAPEVASAQAAAEAAAKRAELEAELQAVLAEETGVLPSFDESAEDEEENGVVEARGVVNGRLVL